MRVARPGHLARQALHHFWRDLLPLVMTLLVGAVLLSALGTLRATVEDAARSGIAAHFGGPGHVMQPASHRARDAGLAQAGWAPLADHSGRVTAGGRVAPAQVRTYTDASLSLGLLSEGSHPTVPGEVTLGAALAAGLGVGSGDTVMVAEPTGVQRRVRVTGLVRDPIAMDGHQVYLLASVVPSEHVSAFVAVTDPLQDPAGAALLTEGLFTYASLPELQARAAESALRASLGPVTAVAWGIALSLGIAGLVGTRSLMGRLSSSLRGLTAAGLPSSSRRSFLLLVVAPPLLVASLAGNVLGYGSVALLRPALAGLFGHDWITSSWGPPEGLLTATPVVVGVLAVMAGDGGGSLRHRAWPRIVDPDAMGTGFATVGGLALAALGLLAADDLVMGSSLVGLFLAGLALVLLPWPLGAVVRRARMSPLLRRATAPAAMPALAVSLLMATVITVVVSQTARAELEAAQAEAAARGRTLPAGSLAVDSIPASQAHVLLDMYREFGGEAVLSFVLPLEDAGAVRVIDPDTAECLRRETIDDPFAAEDVCGVVPSVRYVMLDADGAAPTRAAADVEHGGRASVIIFSADGTATAPREVAAHYEPTLVPPLAGLVVGQESSVADQLGLVPSDLHQVVLTDFGALTDGQRAVIRGMVLRQAPGAEMIEIERDGTGARTALLLLVGVAGWALGSLLLWTGARAVRGATREVRTVLILFGTGPSSGGGAYRGVTLGWLITVATGALGGMALAWIVAGVSGASPGWVWAVAPGGLLVSVVAAAFRQRH